MKYKLGISIFIEIQATYFAKSFIFCSDITTNKTYSFGSFPPELFPGPWFNIKMLSYQYRNSNCGDKTILRPSYLHYGISYTGKIIRWHLYIESAPWVPFYLHGLTLIQSWISNYRPGKVWDKITYPFLNFNGATVHPRLYNGCNYLSKLGLKLNHVSKRGYWKFLYFSPSQNTQYCRGLYKYIPIPNGSTVWIGTHLQRPAKHLTCQHKYLKQIMKTQTSLS